MGKHILNDPFFTNETEHDAFEESDKANNRTYNTPFSVIFFPLDLLFSARPPRAISNQALNVPASRGPLDKRSALTEQHGLGLISVADFAEFLARRPTQSCGLAAKT